MYQGKVLLCTGKNIRPLWNLLHGLRLRKNIRTLDIFFTECFKIKSQLT